MTNDEADKWGDEWRMDYLRARCGAT